MYQISLEKHKKGSDIQEFFSISSAIYFKIILPLENRVCFKKQNLPKYYEQQIQLEIFHYRWSDQSEY